MTVPFDASPGTPAAQAARLPPRAGDPVDGGGGILDALLAAATAPVALAGRVHSEPSTLVLDEAWPPADWDGGADPGGAVIYGGMAISPVTPDGAV